jgi:hypothetical protein
VLQRRHVVDPAVTAIATTPRYRHCRQIPVKVSTKEEAFRQKQRAHEKGHERCARLHAVEPEQAYVAEQLGLMPGAAKLSAHDGVTATFDEISAEIVRRALAEASA